MESGKKEPMMDEETDVVQAMADQMENERLMGLIQKEASICLQLAIDQGPDFSITKPTLENAASQILYLAGKIKE